MATLKERQKAYRERRSAAGESGERRLQTWVSTATDLALDRLARHHGVTRKAMLERLILAADEQVGRKMGDTEFAAYIAVMA